MDVFKLPACDFLRDGATKLAIDFGGSMTKIVYIKPSDDQQFCEVRTISFPNTDEESTWSFLRNLGHWKSGEVAALGISVDEKKDTLEQILGTSYELEHEFNGLVNCFRWLVKLLPKHEIVYELCEEAVMAAEHTIKMTQASYVNWTRRISSEFLTLFKRSMFVTKLIVMNSMDTYSSRQRQGGCSIVFKMTLPIADPSLPEGFFKWPRLAMDKHIPYVEADPELYPCLLVVLGSACCVFKVDDPYGKYTYTNTVSRCGRSILGLASILLDLMDFPEMMDLAERGDSKCVNGTMTGISNFDVKEEKQDSYNTGFLGDYICWAYGKTLGKHLSTYRREDIMRSILTNVITDLAQIVTLEAQVHGVKRVFFAGSLITHPLVRSEFIRQLGMHKVFAPKSNVEFNFLLHGGFYSAIGAMLGKPTKNE